MQLSHGCLAKYLTIWANSPCICCKVVPNCWLATVVFRAGAVVMVYADGCTGNYQCGGHSYSGDWLLGVIVMVVEVTVLGIGKATASVVIVELSIKSKYRNIIMQVSSISASRMDATLWSNSSNSTYSTVACNYRYIQVYIMFSSYHTGTAQLSECLNPQEEKTEMCNVAGLYSMCSLCDKNVNYVSKENRNLELLWKARV